MMKNMLLVGLGGFLGSIARYLTYWLVDRRLESLYPWSTFIVNITGSLLLGILLGFFVKANVANENMRLLLAVGFCGSFTTFSSFMFENLFLFQHKAGFLALTYTLASLVLGLLAVFTGQYISKAVL